MSLMHADPAVDKSRSRRLRLECWILVLVRRSRTCAEASPPPYDTQIDSRAQKSRMPRLLDARNWLCALSRAIGCVVANSKAECKLTEG